MEGSETLLARMVDNVIDNAVRHNQPHGFINVTCEADRETARLVVESGGPVLDQAAVAQLAEPFRRLGAERTGSQNGHGLGPLDRRCGRRRARRRRSGSTPASKAGSGSRSPSRSLPSAHREPGPA